MEIIEEILSEYVRMRENGLEPKQVLTALRPFIDRLEKNTKERLAQSMRAWERGTNSATPPPPPETRSSVIKPLAGDAGRRTGEVPQAMPEPASIRATTWMECPNCTAKNRLNDIFCYACGLILDDAASQLDTRHFADGTGVLFSDDYFGADSLVIFNVRDTDLAVEVRPQRFDKDIIVGRSTGTNAMMPDVDLARANAAEFGVSRLHVAFRYDNEANAIQVYDLGSSNGSFINGQRLHPKEVRVLRHNDELRLGRLVLRVAFHHPGDPI